MKRKENLKENKIKQLAESIVKMEKAKDEKGLETLISNLTLEEMFEIDEYIYQKKLLTK